MTASYLSPRHLIAGRDEHPLGVGCRPIGGPAINEGRPVGWAHVADSSAVDALLRAHALGATVYDTSDVYGLGHSQRVLGRMLAQVPRSSVRIACTVGTYKGTGQHAYSSLNLFRQVEQTQENLGVKHLDVLILAHADFGPRDRYLDEARDTLKALCDSGDITAIGMRVPGILSARPATPDPSAGYWGSQTRYDFLFDQLNPQVLSTAVSPLEPQACHTAAGGAESVFSFARRRGIATMIHEPLLQGLLTGKYHPDSAFSPGDVRSLYTPAHLQIIDRSMGALRNRFGTNPRALARVALHYSLRRCPDSIVLAGISSPEQAEANFADLNSEMTDDDYVFVERTYTALRIELGQQAASVVPR
ncbi:MULTISPECIES: aldo/keto reductase [unclassified Streptomyces]|uniref:aldo/keto reductase n=1 Tax=unclassified Streptomyces TaxID=2593676 RepID=UPI001C2ED247|nr:MULTISPECIES: aldo/keto reductase [unclassified Streptomyces]MBV1949112.1 aldo/keto reductase [Streptomyces sp. BV129]